ncbi:MAG TPA: BatD family protein [Rhodanobacteraceae bacterium]|nr:BatD family protein [Rhodanobacteraceae bacterium]
MMGRWWIVLLVLLAPLTQAATMHAFLDRNHVSLGDTVTLNIQSSGSIGAPDLSPLQKDFQVLGTSRSSSVQIVNGKATATSQLGIALKPLRAGTLTIPPFDVGGAKTRPLTLHVGAAPSGGIGKVGDPVFMETSVLSSSPWVGQQTVYTVRLFYLPDVDGALGDPSADGARLIKLDRDHRYIADRNGYTYKVIERSWALIPQRGGAITVEGPEFQGQRLSAANPGAWFNNPNGLLNGQMPGIGALVHAMAPAARIQVRAAPANAGKPWLPARDVQLKLAGLPSNGEASAGVPLTLTLSVSASGQPADALPEPELPAIADARIYPDQTQDATDDSGQWLDGSRTRSFAIVPQRDGTLTIPSITLNWWNVESGRVEQAKLPAHTLRVTGVVANASTTPAPPPAPSVAATSQNAAVSPARARNTAAPAGTPVFWRGVALASFALWVLAIAVLLAWWWRTRSARSMRGAAAHGTDGTMDAASNRDVTQRGQATATPAAKPDPRALRQRALDAARDGDAASCEHALLEWARALHPGIAHAGMLRDALADGAQRDALDALQRVRWQGGDPSSACTAVASAFARGFTWRGDESAHDRKSDLPPLYPSS